MTLWRHPRTLDRDNRLTGKPRMRVWTTGLALTLGLALVIGGSLAEASQSPPGCNTSGVGLDIQKSATSITNGQTVIYTVKYDNSAAPSCDAASVVIKGFCPDATGQPNILNVTYPTIPNLPAPTAQVTLPTFSCVVNVSGGLTTATARATLTGLLHDNPNVDDLVSVSKDLSVIVENTPPPPPPPQIPTLSEWVMIMLAVFVALVGVATLRRKRIA